MLNGTSSIQQRVLISIAALVLIAISTLLSNELRRISGEQQIIGLASSNEIGQKQKVSLDKATEKARTTIEKPLSQPEFKKPMTGPKVETVKQNSSDDFKQEYHLGSVNVMLWAYARGGSSILGEVFNQNPDVFYWYEPDMLLNVFLFGNGVTYEFTNNNLIPTERQRKLVFQQTIQKILTCDILNLPPDFFSNENLYMMKKVFDAMPSCVAISLNISQKCRENIDRFRNRSRTAFLEESHSRIASGKWFSLFGKNRPSWSFIYESCLDTLQYSLCVREIKRACVDSPIRVIKFVSVQAQQIDWLLEKFGEKVKLIHNVRDPRAITHSRCKVQWNGACSTDGRVLAELTKLCSQMKRNIDFTATLNQSTIKQIKYEFFVRKPIQVISAIYKWLRLIKPPDIVYKVFHVESRVTLPSEYGEDPWGTFRSNPVGSADKWRTDLNAGLLRKMSDVPLCQQLFSQLNYN